MKVDCLIVNVIIFNSYFRKFVKGNVAIKDGKFLYVGKQGRKTFRADEVIDGRGYYMIPGLIDIHLHIESTMVTPETFSHGLIKNGVTTVVSEPHEMANVFGLKGVTEMIKASQGCVADIFYGIPSSVPATRLETAGGAISKDDIDELLSEKDILCLGEIMNYVEVVSGEPGKTNDIINHIRRRYPELPIEGHVPKLRDVDLQKMLYAGVDSDHTHQTVEGMEERIAAGMFIEIQEKSLSPEIINYLIDHQVTEHFCFVTDDVMPDSFTKHGHLNHIARKAMSMGMSPEQVIYACTYTPARRMKLFDRGSIAPGKCADFILMRDMSEFSIDVVYKDGKKVYSCGEIYDQTSYAAFPETFYRSVRLEPLSVKDFTLTQAKENGQHLCRIMMVKDGSTFTEERQEYVSIHNQELQWETSPFGLIATFERYGKNGNRGYGLIGGDIIKKGAVATTYSHDNHNLLVIGQNAQDMQIAANEIIRHQGGICVVHEGQVLKLVELPVGGILSEKPLEALAEEVESLRHSLEKLGYQHYNAIMSISTLSLPVSPALKITDFGLIDVNKGAVVPLVIN
ncbi:adenine deaminase C-terminal domain-containing protein [Salipaludibacillus agaradhaerens]|jgi:adenine deaminase|uniref:adenine deaminase C-terminal domain-containing protein n=1 Tax=Salipaludibacillus agaradhaerens TaxID=76935 RepID=UPI000998730A|nr:adenine deaminase C-terminal domain-containing protein [Salipaludibacillus agaradhaerens]